MRPWWKGVAPGEIGTTPWLSPPSVEFLAGIIKPGMRVLEHGCGGSTFWFALRGCEVLSTESSLKWKAAMLAKAEELGVRGQIEILDHWPKKPNALGKYDVILVDGNPVTDRAAALIDAFEIYSKPGGWVVLDNYNRPEYKKEFQSIRSRGTETLFNDKIFTYSNTAFWHVFDDQYPMDAK